MYLLLGDVGRAHGDVPATIGDLSIYKMLWYGPSGEVIKRIR